MVSSTRVNPWVTHERLDGEVIAINLETGAYFALAGVAADCWSLLASDAHADAIVATLSARYAVDATRVGDDLAGFLTQLEDAGLVVREQSADDLPNGAPLPHAAGPLEYATPVLERYDDLEELLLLDPIHEVDIAGWPVAAAE